MTLTVAQVNYLNIGLMVLSAALAFWLPFELFLFSYAVLGPLHYLTEISWLHERQFFTEGRSAKQAHKGWVMLVAVTLVALIAGYVAVEGSGAQVSPKWEITLFYLVFVTALFVTVIRARVAIIVTLLISILIMALFARSRYYIVVAFFLVTIIHVLFFTGSFVLYGALRGRSLSGVLSLAVFVICVIAFFVFAPGGHPAGQYVRQSYRSFNALNVEL